MTAISVDSKGCTADRDVKGSHTVAFTTPSDAFTSKPSERNNPVHHHISTEPDPGEDNSQHHRDQRRVSFDAGERPKDSKAGSFFYWLIPEFLRKRTNSEDVSGIQVC